MPVSGDPTAISGAVRMREGAAEAVGGTEVLDREDLGGEGIVIIFMTSNSFPLCMPMVWVSR